MEGVSTEDLVLAYVARWGPDPDGDPPAFTPREVGTALSGSEPRLSRLLELLSAIERLQERGELRTREAADGTARFVPTERGLERARAVRERLASEPVVLADGDREELPLGEAADRLGRRLVAVAEAVTDDGVYRPDDPVDPGFVDRTEELAALRAELDRVRDGAGRAAVVTGPAGVGKTALVDHFLDGAEGVETLRGRARGEGGVAYGPLRDALAGLDGDPVADLAADHRDDHGAGRADGPGIDHPGDPGTDHPGGSGIDHPGTPGADHPDDPDAVAGLRGSLFRDLTDLLAPGPGDPPRVLFLDDLHLAGPGTFAYLAHLLGDLDGRRLFVLASYRPGELPGAAPDGIRNATGGEPDPRTGSGGETTPSDPGDGEADSSESGDGETAPSDPGDSETAPSERADDPSEPGPGPGSEDDPPVLGLDLEPFDREATRRLVAGTVGTRRVPGAFVAAVAERTGGVPLFVEATVEALLETDRLDPDLGVYPEDPEAIDLPGAVRATVDDRIDRLPGPARGLLRWAAVLGERFEADALVAVADPPTARSRRYLGSLVEGGPFDRTGDGGLAFRSEVVREALLSGLPEAERRRRHARVAAALADLPGTDAATVAHHRERAGDPERAVAAHRRAADEALAVYAHRTAIDHCRAALALAREADDRGALVESALRLSGIHRTVGEYDEAERFGRFARERAATGDERRRALARLARVATDRGDHGRAEQLTEEGLAVAGDDELAARLLSVRAEAEFERGRFDDCLQRAERQLALAEDAGADDLRADAHRRLGTVHVRRSEHDRAREHLRAAVDARRAQADDDPRTVADIRRELGLIAMNANDSEAASRHFEAALEGFEQVGDRHAVAETHYRVGAAYWEQEDHGRIREHFEAALAEFEAVGDRHGVGKVHGDLGALALARGDREAGREHVETALEALRSVGDRQGAGVAHLNLGAFHLDGGEYGRAREHYEAALSVFRETGDRDHARNALWSLAEVAVQRGEFERAREHGEAAFALDGIPGLSPDDAGPFRAIVDHAVATGDDELVEEWCDRALDALATFDVDATEPREWIRERLDELDGTTE